LSHVANVLAMMQAVKLTPAAIVFTDPAAMDVVAAGLPANVYV
jgi:hypothetical protein